MRLEDSNGGRLCEAQRGLYLKMENGDLFYLADQGKNGLLVRLAWDDESKAIRLCVLPADIHGISIRGI